MDGEIRTDACIRSIPYAMETFNTTMIPDRLLRIEQTNVVTMITDVGVWGASTRNEHSDPTNNLFCCFLLFKEAVDFFASSRLYSYHFSKQPDYYAIKQRTVSIHSRIRLL